MKNVLLLCIKNNVSDVFQELSSSEKTWKSQVEIKRSDHLAKLKESIDDDAIYKVCFERFNEMTNSMIVGIEEEREKIWNKLKHGFVEVLSVILFPFSKRIRKFSKLAPQKKFECNDEFEFGEYENTKIIVKLCFGKVTLDISTDI